MISIDLSGRVVLVLGGSRGIGASIVETVCRAGGSAVFTHTGNPEYAGRVESLVKSIEAEGGSVQAITVDALDSEATERLTARVVKDHGRIDGLVCNVGKNLARPVDEITDEDWRTFLDLNLTSAFYGVRAAVPHMERAGGGMIVLIGSSAVYDGGGGAADYAAPKAGLEGLMAYLCRNYLRKGIITNVIHPCVIETDLLKERYGDPEKKKQLIAQVPAGRLGQPEDIAGLTAYLLSGWGGFICGQKILVDGGRTFFNK